MCTSPHTLCFSTKGHQNTFLLKKNTERIIHYDPQLQLDYTVHPPCGLHSRCVHHILTTSWNNTDMKSVCGHSIYEQWNPSHLKSPKNIWPCMLLEHLTSHRTGRCRCSSRGRPLLTSVLHISVSVCYLQLRYAASPPWRLGSAEHTWFRPEKFQSLITTPGPFSMPAHRKNLTHR